MVTIEDARLEVERRMRRPLNPQIWDYLVEKYYVEEYLEGGYTAADLVA